MHETPPSCAGRTPAALLVLLICSTAFSADAVAPAKLTLEPPTLHCLGFRWHGSGDDNLNARVEVHYRKAGEEEWKRGLDLIRIEPGQDRPLFAGSLFDLQEATTYQVRLTMSDPDGVEGQAPGSGDRPARTERTVTLTTASAARIPEEMNVRHAYMAEHRGKKLEPNYIGLLNTIWGGHMYNRRSSDWASAGDLVLIHSGHYQGKKFSKRDFRGHLVLASSGWHGYPLGRDCPPDRPLVIKAAGDGEVVIDGAGMNELFDLRGARNVIIEGLTIQNAGIVFQFSETGDTRPSSNVTIRNCIIRDVAHVALGDHPDNRNIHITDCKIIGRQQRVLGAWGDTFSRQAITINGKGHVFNHNKVVDFFDFVNASGPTVSAIEVANNDLQRIGDNSICFNSHSMNCVAIRNRMLNAGDPQQDNRNRTGPTYWIRNVVFNQHANRGFKNDGGIGGIVALHNTMAVYPRNFHTFAYGRLQNNLFLGGLDKRGNPTKAGQAIPEQRTVLNHNGWLMRNAQFVFADNEMKDFAAFQQASGLGEGGVAVDFDDFVSAPDPHKLDKQWPHNITILDPGKIDLRLRASSEAIDAGIVIPGVNEDFTGRGPDLGACEQGKPAPHCGPRCTFPEPFRWRELDSYDPLPKRPADPGRAVLRVSCGTPWDYEDPYGRLWLGDQRYRWDRPWGYVGNPNGWHDQRRRGQGIGTPLTQLYRFERGEIEAYVFTLPAGDYLVRMHFVERWGQGRIFDVVANNRMALKDFDIFTAAGGDHKPVVRECKTTVTGNKLRIDFLRKAGGNPIINGLEIFRIDQED